MSSSTLQTLIERNAQACETAKHPKCRCRCRGLLHGKKHSREWIAEQVGSLQNELDFLAGSDDE